MKQIIFNQRVTVFTNSFIGYSDNYEQELRSNFDDIDDIGVLQPNLAIMISPQQIISPNQIPQNAAWFIKICDIKVEFLPNKIDIVSDLFINSEKDEITRLNQLTKLLININKIISIGSITRIAYAPSFGLEYEDTISIDNHWKSIINIPDIGNSCKQEKMVRYNTQCKQDFCKYKNIIVNRVVTISEGQRVERRNTPKGEVNNKRIECMIVSLDINTSGNTGNYSIESVDTFCKKAQSIGRELLDYVTRLSEIKN